MKLFMNFSALVVAIAIFLPSAYATIHDDIEILSESDSQIELLYLPEPIGSSEVQTELGPARIITIKGCGNSGLPGLPALPVRSVMVGVPFGTEIEIMVVDSRTTEENGWLIAPIPTLERPHGDEIYIEKLIFSQEAYSQNMFAPETAVSMEGPFTFRDQRVVRVNFHPIRYNPARREVLLYSEVRAKLRFKRASQSVPPPADKLESSYRNLLINYKKAKSWRHRRPLKKALGEGFFSKGEWFKIELKEDGIYRITYDEMKSAGIDVNSIDPRAIKIYYGGGEELPLGLYEPRRTEPGEIPIYIEGEKDGSFDSQDYILFYGEGASRWKYDPEMKYTTYILNRYSSSNFYWLTFGSSNGKRIPLEEDRAPSEDRLYLGKFVSQMHEEVERFPVHENSGTEWFWELYDYSKPSGNYPFLAYNANTDDSLTVKFKFIMPQDGIRDESFIQAYLNGEIIGTVIMKKDSTFSIKVPVSLLNPGEEGKVSMLKLRLVTQNTKLFFDWYEIEYPRKFVAYNDEIHFTTFVGDEGTGYRVGGFKNTPRVFDISDLFDVKEIKPVFSGQGELSFGDPPLSGHRSYYIATSLRWKKPIGISKSENSDLRNPNKGADYIIITHPDFYDQALVLADWREKDVRFDGPLSTEVAKTNWIFNEFSYGLPDPAAIRDFLKYAFENWNPRPSYVAFLGDGIYDYKNNAGSSPVNWVPPYERGKSCVEEWYTWVEGDDEISDIAVGRIPARNQEEAEIMVRKIIDYDKNPDHGIWQNRVLMVADDELGSGFFEPYFVRDSEAVDSDLVPDYFNRAKVYLTEYEPDELKKKPGAKKDIVEWINRGVSIFNFIGHGNYDVLTHEYIFKASTDISLLENGPRLPIYFSASCNNAEFDHPTRESLAEKLLRKDGGGTIATIAASRETYHSSNLTLNREFYRRLFSRSPAPRVGLALMEAKSIMNRFDKISTNTFVLIGDPATRLSIPTARVQIVGPDTLSALDKPVVLGEVIDQEGNLLSSFEGEACIEIFDSAYLVTREMSNLVTVNYLLPGATIFRGTIPVEGGKFTSSSFIPKDISYGGNFGKISAFVWSDEIDGSGAIDSIYVGGTKTTHVEDSSGPLIDIGFEGQNFADGDVIGSSPVLKAKISDESGINITGGVGHEIKLTVDSEVHKVTEFFVAENDYQQGTLRYQLKDLEPGEHAFRIKAWDNLNNSSLSEVTAIVLSEEKLSIRDLLFFPNPLTGDNTAITYELSAPAEVGIKIFTVSGRLVEKIQGTGLVGYNEVFWYPDPKIANGIYLVQVTARGDNGKTVKAGRLWRS